MTSMNQAQVKTTVAKPVEDLEKAAAGKPKPPAKGFAILIKVDCALGSGTRKAGDKIATVYFEKESTIHELSNALRNPHLIHMEAI